jgi:hypothetical protein
VALDQARADASDHASPGWPSYPSTTCSTSCAKPNSPGYWSD